MGLLPAFGANIFLMDWVREELLVLLDECFVLLRGRREEVHIWHGLVARRGAIGRHRDSQEKGPNLIQ